MARQVTYTLSDVRVTALQVAPNADGTLALHARYVYLDDQGREVWELGERQHMEALDGTQTFSAVLGLTSQTLTGKANQQVKVARDVVRDHVGDLLEWVKTRIRVKEGL